MRQTTRKAVWSIAFLVLVAFAVPWFLWGSSEVVAGLPVWLWWHVGWMGLAAVVFYAFTRRAWDDLMGVDGNVKRADGRTDGGVKRVDERADRDKSRADRRTDGGEHPGDRRGPDSAGGDGEVSEG